jgi:hypothetical protein
MKMNLLALELLIASGIAFAIIMIILFSGDVSSFIYIDF